MPAIPLILPKQARLELIARALTACPAVATEAAACDLIGQVCDGIEDLFSGEAYEPYNDSSTRIYGPLGAEYRRVHLMNDGTMIVYYVHRRSKRDGHSHRTYIGSNGSFRIFRLLSNVDPAIRHCRNLPDHAFAVEVLAKPGADGEVLWIP